MLSQAEVKSAVDGKLVTDLHIPDDLAQPNGANLTIIDQAQGPALQTQSPSATPSPTLDEGVAPVTM